MLSGPYFRSAFVFSINLLILPGFPLTSFHLGEASLLYLLLCGFILLRAVVPKCLLFIIIIHIFSTHFAINLVFLRNLKM